MESSCFYTGYVSSLPSTEYEAVRRFPSTPNAVSYNYIKGETKSVAPPHDSDPPLESNGFFLVLCFTLPLSFFGNQFGMFCFFVQSYLEQANFTQITKKLNFSGIIQVRAEPGPSCSQGTKACPKSW